MGKFNFEEYRQPWETGPHWELKREFMEKYQDDFPEDRLLCLAQAYSNIELMNCSYPDPVMLQVHELSKPLKGCKRFRELKKDVSKDEPELKAHSGKRSAFQDSKKPFKFVKFYSVGNQFDQQKTEDNTPIDSTKSNTSEDKTSNLVIPSEKDPTLTFNKYESINKYREDLLRLCQSPDFELLEHFAEARKKLLGKKGTGVEEIERVVEILNLQGMVHFKFENVDIGETPAVLCRFYIKDTLVYTGRCANQYSARLNAANNSMEIFENISNLPLLPINELKSSTHANTIAFLCKFLKEFTNPCRLKHNTMEKLRGTVNTLKCNSKVTFFHIEDLESPLNTRLYRSYMVIDKVLICTGKGTHKKKANSRAVDKSVSLFQEFAKRHCPEIDIKTLNPQTDLPVSSKGKNKNKSKKVQNMHLSSDSQESTNQVVENVSKPILEQQKTPTSHGDPDFFRLNYTLLDNSLQQNFVILDTRAIIPNNQVHLPQTTLQQSVQFCKKNVEYQMSDYDPDKNNPNYRCNIILEQSNIGSGEGDTKNEAKKSACAMALQNLQKRFYTIVVKSELDEGFVIKREQMMQVDVTSNALSESNIGCKMLKMMGWTGGGIGKTGGIIEPIMPGEHRFHQGLGFADKKGDDKRFRINVESLLKEFSQTNTTSELVFSTDFTKEERKLIHRSTGKFGLHSTSRGKNDERRLFVKHKFSAVQLLNHLVEFGGSTLNHQLVDRSTG